MRRINTMEIGVATFFIALLGVISFHMVLRISLYDAWISIIIGSFIGLIPVGMYLYLNKKNTNGIILLNKNLFGKYIGWLINFLLVFILFLNTCFLTSYLASYINIWYLNTTPSMIVMILTLLIAIYAFHAGSGTLFRSVNMFFYFMVLLLLFLLIGVFGKMDMSNLLPFLEQGIKNPILGGVLYGLFSSTLLLTFLIVPNKKIVDLKKNSKNMILFYLLGQLCSLFLMIATSAMLHPIIASMYQNPEYIAFSKVSIFSSIEKLQSIMALSVILILFVGITFSFYFVNEGMTQFFKMEHKKKMRITIPIFLLIVVMSFYMLDHVSFYLTTFYPVLLLVIWLLFSIIFMRSLFKKFS